MPRNRRSRRSGWKPVLEAQAAMWTVLGVRVPQLLAGHMTPAERTRMVAEKMEAAAESQWAALEAAGRLMRRPARTPSGVASAAAAVVSAAFAPYHRTVTANAKRLTKARAPRSS